MELTSIVLARALAFMDVNDLNPRGGIFFPHLVPAIVERFGFQQWPTKIEDFDETTGVAFKSGYFEGQTIDEITVYGDGLKIDTRSSTEQGRKIMEETLEWLASEYGLEYHRKTILRWAYVSNITFHSDFDLDTISPAINSLTSRVSKELSNDPRRTSALHVDGFSIELDREINNKQLAGFTIQRRAKMAAAEGRYFSGAPLSTAIHISVIEEFEDNVRNQGWTTS